MTRCRLLVGLTLLLLAPSGAGAATATFTYTGIEQAWTVLPGVTSVDIVATGAAGATAAGTGGLGAVAQATVAVVPGDVLYVNVGGAGTVPTGGYGGGGFNGGGPGYAPGAAGDASGGGGGASDVRTCPSASCAANDPSTDARIVVAAGGGGGGGRSGTPGAGGVGAPGGLTSGGDGGGALPLMGGRGASTTAGGDGGSGAGSVGGGDGGRFQGGVAGISSGGSGGGGGGGYFGGGGGGAGTGTSGAGGGAGSSFAHASTTGAAFATSAVAAGSVTLTYIQRLPEIASAVGNAFSFPGVQPRGATTAAQVLTFSNTGLAPLVIRAVEVTGPAAGDFAVAGNSCTSPVAPAGTCAVLLAFTPTAAGVRTATLRVTSNDLTDATIELALTGEGGVPKLVLEPAAGLSFGPQEIATMGAPKDTVIRNAGTTALQIAGVEVLGSTDFVLAANSCTGPVAPGATCTATLRFSPRATGVRQGTLRIRSNDPTRAAADAPLSGTGATRAQLRAPSISALSVVPKSFVAANRGGPVAPAPRATAGVKPPRVGGQVSFRLSSAASVRFSVERALRGVRRGTRCVAPPRTGAAGEPACTRYAAVRGSFAYRAKTGRNGFLYSGRLSGRTLAVGSYRLRAVATDGAKRRSTVARASFRIVRSPSV